MIDVKYTENDEVVFTLTGPVIFQEVKDSCIDIFSHSRFPTLKY